MTNFDAWLNQADMPEKRDGQWVDLETGIPYNPAHDYIGRAPRKTISNKAQDSRNAAKMFGGKALTGSAKQKEWAEKIRAGKLAEMSAEQAEMVCDPKGLGRSAHFWIENRAKTPGAIAGFFVQYKALNMKCDALKKSGSEKEYAAAAAEYNALTTVWGFTK